MRSPFLLFLVASLPLVAQERPSTSPSIHRPAFGLPEKGHRSQHTRVDPKILALKLAAVSARRLFAWTEE
jgi:hypothetical protein